MDTQRRVVKSKTLPLVQAQPHSAPISSPGVLILGRTRELLYMTPSAHTLLTDLEGLTSTPWNGTALPLAVQHVCTELQDEEQQDYAGSDWNRMQVRHIVRTAHGTILVRGYGIYEQRGSQTGRFLILLEPVLTDSSPSDTNGPTDYHFTVRQRAILNGLVLGQTNKEIAENLKISVHTVKEYIRQLMMKLQTPSRTGIVARVAGLTLPSPKSSSHRKSQIDQVAVQGA